MAMSGLVYVQLQLFKEDVAVYEQQFNLRIPQYLSQLHDVIRNDRKWVDAVNVYEGQEAFIIESFERPPEEFIFSGLKDKIDYVFERNGLNIEYEIEGLISGNTRCFFYASDSSKSANPIIERVTEAEHHICLCGPNAGASHGRHGDDKYTAFDISLSYPNFIGRNATMLKTTILLMLVIVLAFAYIIITLNKQKKLSALKNDFINNLTHEFKTPIFSISLASSLLRKSDEVLANDKLVKYTELIDNEGKRLKSQVDKVLQMALIDSGNFKLEKRQVDLHSLITKVAKSFELIINERGGEIELELNAKNSTIYADETHLNNIIYNLLDNAQKYTEESPKIQIFTSDQDDGIELSVKDNGIGMGKETQRFVFDKFYRAESGNVHNVKGFGLGLSYVKSVVDAHRGRIGIKSQQDIGSEFKIYLPIS